MKREPLIPAPKQPGIPKKGPPTGPKHPLPPPKAPPHPVRTPTGNQRGR